MAIDLFPRLIKDLKHVDWTDATFFNGNRSGQLAKIAQEGFQAARERFLSGAELSQGQIKQEKEFFQLLNKKDKKPPSAQDKLPSVLNALEKLARDMEQQREGLSTFIQEHSQPGINVAESVSKACLEGKGPSSSVRDLRKTAGKIEESAMRTLRQSAVENKYEETRDAVKEVIKTLQYWKGFQFKDMESCDLDQLTAICEANQRALAASSKISSGKQIAGTVITAAAVCALIVAWAKGCFPTNIPFLT